MLLYSNLRANYMLDIYINPNDKWIEAFLMFRLPCLLFTSLFRILETLIKGLASAPNLSYIIDASIFQLLIFLGEKKTKNKNKQIWTILIMWICIWDIICACTSCYCKGWYGVAGVLFAELVKIMSGNLKTWKWGEGSVCNCTSLLT